jgi:hypothetical protein
MSISPRFVTSGYARPDSSLRCSSSGWSNRFRRRSSRSCASASFSPRGSRRRSRSVHRSGDHPGPSSLHRDGVYLELSDGRGSGLYLGPAVRKQFDHARVICADCRPTGERRLVVVRSLCVLLYSLLAFIVITLAIGWGLRAWLLRHNQVSGVLKACCYRDSPRTQSRPCSSHWSSPWPSRPRTSWA